MSRWIVYGLLVVFMTMSTSLSLAEEGQRVPIIGGAIPVDQATDAPYQGALREGLRQLGYVDGKNYRFVARYADGDSAKLRAIIKELIDLRVINDEPDALNRSGNFNELARREGMTVLSLPVGSYHDIQAALKTIHKERPQVLVVWSSPLLTQYRAAIIKAVGHQLPVISDGRFFAEAGALMTYSVDWSDLFRRSASYIDKILKGAKPGDLPIEQPSKFELVVNLQTAKVLHMKMPESILVRADKVIR